MNYLDAKHVVAIATQSPRDFTEFSLRLSGSVACLGLMVLHYLNLVVIFLGIEEGGERVLNMKSQRVKHEKC